jgi:hypothetical protein
MLSNKLIRQGPVIATAILATTLVVGARALAAPASFDGPWSVLVVTEQGTCDQAYRYGIQISNGRVVYEGGSAVDISGRVTPRGQVNVEVRHGDQRAIGVGRLSQASGGGRWSGSSPNQQCAGHWTAERRNF